MTKDLDRIIWQLVAAIPRGQVATYGQIARLAGYPSHARYVGTVLKQLPADSTLPWHRVINSKGELSFPTETDAYQCQQLRLREEGIEFWGKKIRLQRYLWDV